MSYSPRLDMFWYTLVSPRLDIFWYDVMKIILSREGIELYLYVSGVLV